jgi:hypothetical protein
MTLAGFVHEIRKLRNFVHPGVWAREHPKSTKFSKAAYNAVFEVFDVGTSWLLHRVHQKPEKADGASRANLIFRLHDLKHTDRMPILARMRSTPPSGGHLAGARMPSGLRDDEGASRP